MAKELYMPKNGMDMTEGTLVRWLKEVGEHIQQGEPFMEIETDKVTMEAESPDSGVLLKKLFENDSVVPVLTTVGYIGQLGETAPETPAVQAETVTKAPKTEAEQTRETAPTVEAPVKMDGGVAAATPRARALARELGIDLRTVCPGGPAGEIRERDVLRARLKRVKATPLAKAMAAGRGVDINTLQGSGFGGKIVKADVCAAAEAKTDPRKLVPLSSMRKVISKRMSASHAEIPNVTSVVKTDVTELLEFRKKLNEGREKAQRITVNDLIIAATAKAVAKHERFLLSIDGGSYVVNEHISIGVAVGIDDGLLVPVIRDADKKTLDQLSSEAKELAAKAKSGKLRPEDMGGGCISISNLGMFGTYMFTPIINQPEAAILGIGSTEDELALIDGQVVVRKKMMVCLTFDHRILNGTEASKFQWELKRILETPEEITAIAGGENGN